jgi:hypothetical protein
MNEAKAAYDKGLLEYSQAYATWKAIQGSPMCSAVDFVISQRMFEKAKAKMQDVENAYARSGQVEDECRDYNVWLGSNFLGIVSATDCREAEITGKERWDQSPLTIMVRPLEIDLK